MLATIQLLDPGVRMLTAGTGRTAQNGADSTEQRFNGIDGTLSTVAVDLLLSCGCCVQVLISQHRMGLTVSS